MDGGKRKAKALSAQRVANVQQKLPPNSLTFFNLN